MNEIHPVVYVAAGAFAMWCAVAVALSLFWRWAAPRLVLTNESLLNWNLKILKRLGRLEEYAVTLERERDEWKAAYLQTDKQFMAVSASLETQARANTDLAAENGRLRLSLEAEAVERLTRAGSPGEQSKGKGREK